MAKMPKEDKTGYQGGRDDKSGRGLCRSSTTAWEKDCLIQGSRGQGVDGSKIRGQD